MEFLRQYLLRIVAAALLGGMVRALLPKEGTVGAMTRLMTGLLLTAVVIAPLTKISLDSWQDFFLDLDTDAQAAVAQGEAATRDSLQAIIKSRVEAYILDKADSFGATLTVEVTMDEGTPPLPAQVRLGGSISPYGRAELETCMQEELGIAKEQIIWTG